MRESQTTKPSYVLARTLRRWCLRGRNILLPLRMSSLNIWGKFLLNYHVRNKMVSKVFVSLRLEKLINVLLINVLLRAESVCLQSTPLVSIFYLCYGFSRYAYWRYGSSRYAYLRYAFSRYVYLSYGFSRYAYLRYTYLRYAFLRYAFSRYAFYHSVCLSAFWLAAWYMKRVFALQLRFDAFPIWNIESACCYSALAWCIYNLDNLISIPGYWILSYIYLHILRRRRRQRRLKAIAKLNLGHRNKFEIKFYRISRCSSRSSDNAELVISRCPFAEDGKEMYKKL